MTIRQRLVLYLIRTKFRLVAAISKRKAAAIALDLFCTPKRRITKKPPPVFKDAEQLQFDLEGIPVRGYRWNHGGGRKVLIIHGFESSIVNFDHYIRPLVRKGYEVLAFDAPGHGISGGKKITAPLYAKMIARVHHDFGPVQSFLTHSFGGLALSIALETFKHDETFRIVFIAPATESRTAIDQFFNLLQLKNGVRKEFDILISKIGGHPAEWYSIRRSIKGSAAHILWIHDQDDLQTPISDALKVKDEQLPNLEFVMTKGLGHRKIYRDPQTVKQVLDFL